MLVIPAIDLLEGRAVRLAEGDRERVTVYSETPWTLVDDFADAGATRIHVVDLDGAFAGRPVQRDLIARIATAARCRKVEIEVGGGIRDAQAVHDLFELGVDYVVVGTLAVREPDAVAALCGHYPGKIVVAIDARDGQVAVEGWTETSAVTAADLAEQAAGWGAGALLYTDVARDGLQVGANVEATAQLQSRVEIPVIASGGVGTLDDLRALKSAQVRAVVMGRAIYEGSFTVKEAIEC